MFVLLLSISLNVVLTSAYASSLNNDTIARNADNLTENSAENSGPSLYQVLFQQAQTTKLSSKRKQEIQQIIEQSAQQKNIQLQLEPLDLAPFHFREKPTQLKRHVKQAQGFCGHCHSNTPHKKSAKTRSFLNMHAKNIACQTCHLTSETAQLSYQWQQLSPTRERNKQRVFKQIDFSQKANYLLIPVFHNQAVMPIKQSNFAQNLLKNWPKNDTEQTMITDKQIVLWQNIHQILDQQKTTCGSCHQQNKPRLNLVELGASQAQKERFEQNIIARFFMRYAKEDDKINLLELLN